MPAGYYALTVPALAAPGAAQPLAGPPRRAGPLRPQPAAREPAACAAWCRRCSTVCCPAQTRRTARSRVLDDLLDEVRLRPACSTSRSAATCAAGASAWRRTGCRSAARSRMCPPSDVYDFARIDRRRPETLARAGHAGAGRGRGGRGDAGRRRGQPLDAGRGRGQGAASVLPAGRPAPLASSRCTWPRAAAPAACAARRCRTSSPPAT